MPLQPLAGSGGSANAEFGHRYVAPFFFFLMAQSGMAPPLAVRGGDCALTVYLCPWHFTR